MKTSNKFSNVIEELNTGIDRFNSFLSQNNQLKRICVTDPTTYTDSIDKPWKQQEWPSKGSFGVYFLIGTSENDNTRIGVYIGKASLKYMGHRMWSHLKPYRDAGIYKKAYKNEQYIIEAMCSTPMPSDSMGCLASALEEFLIKRGLTSANLLNSIGRRQ
jgi:hypothetical protein